MSEFIIKMPDVGEGVAEAEIVEWHVKTGDPVREDMVIAAVMTDKATVEIPSPVNGTVTWLAGEVGDRIAVKAPLVRIETAGDVGEVQFAGISQTPIAGTPKAEIAKPAPPAPTPAPAPAESRLPRPPCGSSPGKAVSILGRCRRPDRPGASCARTSSNS